MLRETGGGEGILPVERLLLRKVRDVVSKNMK